MIPQGQDSINMLRRAHYDPTNSAYKVLTGEKHDFMKQPWVPPGTKAIIHEPTEQHTSWGPKCINAWYLGPAHDHYR